MGMWEDAIGAFTIAVDRGYPSHVNRGLAYERTGQPDRAAEDYIVALSVDPSDLDALVNLGTLELERGAAAEAEALLTRAAGIDPTAYWQLADVSMALGQRDLALTQLARAIDAGEQRAHLDRALLTAESGDYHNVVADFEAAIRAGASGARRQLAIYLDRQGRSEEAYRVASEGIEAGEIECYATAAIIAESMGWRSRAIDLYRSAIRVGDIEYQADLDSLLDQAD